MIHVTAELRHVDFRSPRQRQVLCGAFLFFAVLGLDLSAQGKNIALLPADPDFVLSAENDAAPLCVETTTNSAVARAVGDLASDIERVSSHRPTIIREASKLSGDVVIVGVIGQSPLLDGLVASGKLDAAGLKGSWESYVVQVMESPLPDVRRALVIAGSDRRGAIYGIYEISTMIGVSPWHWWGDVPAAKKSTLTIPAGTRRFGPPSVKYRGIFINDEDWGLQPWAAKTFEPGAGSLGPKTYARIFELMLRLKANTVWPGMHPTTKPFNAFPENKRVADDYAIIMGSSHAEPMLRNNVGEWPRDRAADYNYVTNRDGVLKYWEQRVAENGHFENIYTLGMRGIHDSDMQGPKTDAERIRTLEQVFADQRALIAKHVRSEVDRVPQMFCAYKEVLDLYRQGLRVPDDVTIVWPDDNFGYVRNFASSAERSRSGGFGVYYHLSYLGRPLSYLWLCTTPPALIWEEMHKAYEHGADRLWIANVGDLKPAEITLTFFLDLAWNIDRWTPETLPSFLPDFAARTFGPTHAAEIGALLADYYLLNFQRKPEHLQWWLPRQPRVPSPLTDAEVETRLDAFAQLRQRADALRAKIPAAQQDPFYELVYYPVVGAALANERYFEGERGRLDLARAADARLTTETRFFNEDLAGGKWRGIMSLEPADDQWSSMRIDRWTPPASPRAGVPSPAPNSYVAIDASRFVSSAPGRGVRWSEVPGLGRTGHAMTMLPARAPTITIDRVASDAPCLDYAFTFPAAGTFRLLVYLLPTHPISGDALRFAVAIDDAEPQIVSLAVGDGGPAWAQGVLDAVRVATASLSMPTSGRHFLHIYGLEPGVVFDKIVVDLGNLTPSYLGPPTQN